MSLLAYARGERPPSKQADDLIDDTGVVVRWVERRWFASDSIETYYEVEHAPAGPSRLLEAYACSAYFTSRLLHVHGYIRLTLAVIVGLLALVGLYMAAIYLGPQQAVLAKALELLSAIAVAGALVPLERASDAFKASKAIRKVESDLLDLDWASPAEDSLRSLVSTYDAEHLSGPLVPTWIYKLRRTYLNERWADRRRQVWRDAPAPLPAAPAPGAAGA